MGTRKRWAPIPRSFFLSFFVASSSGEYRQMVKVDAPSLDWGV